MGEKTGTMFLIIAVIAVAIILIGVFTLLITGGGEKITEIFNTQLDKAATGGFISVLHDTYLVK